MQRCPICGRAGYEGLFKFECDGPTCQNARKTEPALPKAKLIQFAAGSGLGPASAPGRNYLPLPALARVWPMIEFLCSCGCRQLFTEMNYQQLHVGDQKPNGTVTAVSADGQVWYR